MINSLLQDNMVSILALGFVLGLKHALDADHLIAVSTIVSERKGIFNSSIVGASWGVGHTASLLIVGLIVIALRIRIPDRVALAMEFAVALMLVILGVNVLLKILHGGKLHMHWHRHGNYFHVHPHVHEAHEHGYESHIHHHRVQISKRPFFVGMVHGMAGSATLMLLVLTTIQSSVLRLIYIGVFGLGSFGGMLIMSALIGLPFTLTAHRFESFHKTVRTAVGIFSVGFGLFLAWQIGFVDGLFLH